MMILNTQGIVLKSVRYKENDLILTIFTKKLGKVSALAKGAKKNKSSLLPCSQIFSYSDYTLKKQKDMYNINQASCIKSFFDLAYDIEAFSYASYVSKIVENSIFENQTNNKLFYLFLNTLNLYTKKDVDKRYITRAFEIKYLDVMGFRPIINRCVSCGIMPKKLNHFSIIEGGAVCENCNDNSIKVDVTTIRLIEYILNNDITVCSKAKVSKYIVYELENITRKYLINYIDNLNLKSLYFLKDVKKGGYNFE